MDERFLNRRVLVTGGLGFLGSNLVRRLVQLGASVTVIDSMADNCGGNSANIADVRDRVEFIRADVADTGLQARLFDAPEHVFSLAGATGHAAGMADPAADLHGNCLTHLSLLEALRRIAPDAKTVLASTRQVYGRPEYLPVDEAHPVRPVDVNGIHMRAAEEYYRLYHEVYGLRSACLRLSNTYGPRMSLSAGCHSVAAVFLQRALAGRPIELFGDGRQRRAFNYVSDVVEAFLKAALLEMDRHEIYNLGHPRHYSLREFADMIAAETDAPVRLRPFPRENQAIDIGDYHADFSKFARIADWRPQVDLAEGIPLTLAYYRADDDGYDSAAARFSSQLLSRFSELGGA